MKLKQITINNFKTFDDFKIEGLTPLIQILIKRLLSLKNYIGARLLAPNYDIIYSYHII
jgi:hypothetical protein